jgi:transposase
MDSHLIRKRFEALSPHIDERVRRLCLASEALAIGRGGVSLVAAETGVSRPTIAAGIRELKGNASSPLVESRIRREGGGRKRIVEKDPELKTALESLVEPVTRGDPESPLRWTSKSLRKLSDELARLGHTVSHRVVGELLEEAGYSLQANSKTNEGGAHPDRNAQFEHINETVKAFQSAGFPVISVDTKKKELIGDFKNKGRELRPKGDPEKVRVYDFIIPELGKASPYGVYDITKNEGWVSVGIDHDTAAFAVHSISSWWRTMGKAVYPEAKELLISADGGGSNGYRVKLWKLELQKLADETGLSISVCHLPPGTSKWNKIEHRLFSFISQNWRGKPLISYEVIVNLIAATTTKAGLTVKCQIDKNLYPKGVTVSEEEIKALNIIRHNFHGEWNYTILPKNDNVIS